MYTSSYDLFFSQNSKMFVAIYNEPINWVNVPDEEHNKIKGENRYIDVK